MLNDKFFQIKFFWLAALGGILFVSCVSEIDFDQLSLKQTPVINAIITPSKATVHLSWSTDIKSDTLEPIYAVRIQLTDLSSNTSYELEKINDFEYKHEGNHPSANYLLEVSIPGYPLIRALLLFPIRR